MKPQKKKQEKVVDQVRVDQNVREGRQESIDLEIEREWLKRIKQDPEEYEKVVRKFYGKIFGYVFKRTHDHDLANEITNETFTKAWDGLPKFQLRGVSIGAYLFQIARNCINTQWKRQNSNSEIVLDPENIEFIDNRQPDDQMLLEEEAKLLFSCFASLSEIQQEVLFHHYRMELTTSKISIVMGEKESTVKSILQRGRKKILEHLTELGLDQTAFAGILQLARSASLKEDGWKVFEGKGRGPRNNEEQ